MITMPLRSNNLGVRIRLNLMLETTSVGSVLPSYDTETCIEILDFQEAVPVYANIAFAMCTFFILLEMLEVSSQGSNSYFADMWNLMDWVNFAMFFLTWYFIVQLQNTHRSCDSEICKTIGYFDDWEVMRTIGMAKLFLSFCICIQLLKIIKFTDTLVPKMNLATSVLRKAGPDLLFFAFVFIMSMVAFGMMFYVQLGPVMGNYNTQIGSLLSLARALFGDFDIDDILNNSRDYLNAIFFLVYLFVAVFILLSMFLTILGEHQQAVRELQSDRRESAGRLGARVRHEYGVLHDASTYISMVRRRAWLRARPLKRSASERPSHTAETAAVSDEGAQRVSRRIDEGQPWAAAMLDDGAQRDSVAWEGSSGRGQAGRPADAEMPALRREIARLSAEVRWLQKSV